MPMPWDSPPRTDRRRRAPPAILTDSGRLQIHGGDLPLLAAFQVVGDLVAFDKTPQTGPLNGGDVHEDVLRAVSRLDEAESLSRVEPLHSASGHVLVSQKTARRNMRTEMLSYLGGNRGGTRMHEDDGRPNTKSAVSAKWDEVEGKARAISSPLSFSCNSPVQA